MSLDRPGKILMIDLEDKEESSAEAMDLKAYFPVTKEVIAKVGVNFDAIHVYQRIIQILEAVPPGRFTTLLIDNVQDFQEGCVRKIEESPEMWKRLGLKEKNVELGSFAGALPGAKRLIGNMFFLAYSKGIKVIWLTFQLKAPWDKEKGPLFDKWKMNDLSIYHEHSRLTLILEDSLPRYYPIPRALVMKEAYAIRQWNEDMKRTVTTRRLPPAIPKCEPQDIWRYLDNPCDFKNLKEGEAVDPLEIARYRTGFSKEQLIVFERAARAQKALGLTPGEDES
jgi:hypothetical protein